MLSSSVVSTILAFVALVVAQDTSAVNTATVTDATAPVQTPSTLASITTKPASRIPLQTTQRNPVASVAPGADIVTTPIADPIATSALTTDVIQPTEIAAAAAQDLFQQIASDNPASVLKGTWVHPVPPIGVSSNYQGTSGLPVATNNFYGNLQSGDGTQPVFVMPYTVFWRKGSGICAWNTDDSKYVFGNYPVESTPGPHYYFSAGGNCPIGFSSAEMDTNQILTTSNLNHQSADVTLSPGSKSGSMKLTLVQGNAFLTSVYNNLQPTFFGGAFTSLAPVNFKAGTMTSGLGKYRVTINNGDTWLIYGFSQNGGSTTLSLTTSTLLTGPAGFSGVYQIAKLPKNYSPSDEAVYDSAAGTYATQNVLSGSAIGTVGTYTFDFKAVSLAGNQLLSFLFPHQQTSVSSGSATSLKLWSNTKGRMQAYLGNTLTFTESNLPTDIQFLPWSPLGNVQNYSASALQAIAAAANAEAAQVMSQQTNLDSMYFSGKALAKFAQICLTINDVLKKDSSSCVSELQQSISQFINNQNIYPLIYDTVWKGAVSSCGNAGCDFGNAWYNDHHFHYGYFVYTAAVIGHINPAWLTTQNKAWINTIIRDFANPSTSDTAFPQFRNFDWYAGHSWAHGIIAAGDGKDEESSSEDYNAIYGMKLWGKVIGDSSMEARGNLMLSVMRRSMQSYMLMSQDNTIQPAAFVPQYAAGITFMNKIDHSTYFGQLEQYIQGIHMIPLTPISAFIRTPSFVAQEWSAVINPILSGVKDGWLGILMANLAISNSTAAYQFFSSSSFSNTYLDGGASLTWYLTYAAGLGGAGNFQLAVGAPQGQLTTAVVTTTATTQNPKTTSAVSGSAINVDLSTTNPTTAASSTILAVTEATGSSSASSLAMQPMQSSTEASGSSSASSLAMQQMQSSTSSQQVPVESSSAQSQNLVVSSQVSRQQDFNATSLVSTSSTSTSTPSFGASKAGQSYVTVTLNAGPDLQVSCANGELLVGKNSSLLTIFQDGSLICGNAMAYLVPQQDLVLYDIVLLTQPPAYYVQSTFAFTKGQLSLTAQLATALAKRQTAPQVPFSLFYGLDMVIKAAPTAQNVTNPSASNATSASIVASSSQAVVISPVVMSTAASGSSFVAATTTSSIMTSMRTSSASIISSSSPAGYSSISLSSMSVTSVASSSSLQTSTTGTQVQPQAGANIGAANVLTSTLLNVVIPTSTAVVGVDVDAMVTVLITVLGPGGIPTIVTQTPSAYTTTIEGVPTVVYQNPAVSASRVVGQPVIVAGSPAVIAGEPITTAVNTAAIAGETVTNAGHSAAATNTIAEIGTVIIGSPEAATTTLIAVPVDGTAASSSTDTSALVSGNDVIVGSTALNSPTTVTVDAEGATAIASIIDTTGLVTVVSPAPSTTLTNTTLPVYNPQSLPGSNNASKSCLSLKMTVSIALLTICFSALLS